jgi:hypothetical protein
VKHSSKCQKNKNLTLKIPSIAFFHSFQLDRSSKNPTISFDQYLNTNIKIKNISKSKNIYIINTFSTLKVEYFLFMNAT